MRSECFVGVEVTFAAILAARECGDYAAIEAAEKGGTDWDAYLADYISRFAYRDFALARLTKLQSVDLRSQVLEQSARLPHRLFWVNSASGESSVALGEFPGKAEAEAAASASDLELLQRCGNDEACRVEALAGYWQAKRVAPHQFPMR